LNPEFILGNLSVIVPAAALHLPATPSRTFENVPAGLNTTYCVGGLASVDLPNQPSIWVFGLSFLKSVYTVFRKGGQGESASVGFARLKGVDYAGNGTAIIGWNGNGVDGSIGITGPNGTKIEVNTTTTPSPAGTVTATATTEIISSHPTVL
jgi:hypothetical protein